MSAGRLAVVGDSRYSVFVPVVLVAVVLLSFDSSGEESKRDGRILWLWNKSDDQTSQSYKPVQNSGSIAGQWILFCASGYQF
jgi:hypothetical protein